MSRNYFRGKFCHIWNLKIAKWSPHFHKIHFRKYLCENSITSMFIRTLCVEFSSYGAEGGGYQTKAAKNGIPIYLILCFAPFPSARAGQWALMSIFASLRQGYPHLQPLLTQLRCLGMLITSNRPSITRGICRRVKLTRVYRQVNSRIFNNVIHNRVLRQVRHPRKEEYQQVSLLTLKEQSQKIGEACKRFNKKII